MSFQEPTGTVLFPQIRPFTPLRLSANIPSQKFSAHSFRRGGATYAFSLDITADVLNAQGSWRSDWYQRCVTRDNSHRLIFTSKMSRGIEGLPR